MKHGLLLLFFAFSLSYGFAQRSTVVQVFPNPASEYIEIEATQDIKKISIINMIGRRVKSFAYSDKERYYIGDLPRGMYLVQFIDPREKILSTQRVNKR